MLDRIKNYMIVVLALFAGYFYISNRLREPCPPQSPAIVKEVVKNQVITKTVTKPDGTVIVKDIKTITETQTEETPVAINAKSRYDIHVGVNPFNRSDYQVGAGVRLGDLPAFGTLDYRAIDQSVLVGVRVEF